ncbi:MAG: HAMP domain-containing sensor histidine kinase [Candidatus Paceibacterota bacterium]|jgi:signal transduction histidine kinase|nr:HAMP domain-containing histidine kinase [bacterium]
MKLNFFKNGKFLQDNKQTVYSIALMVVIPSVIIFNTWLFSQSFKNTVDQSLRDKAVGISQSINISLADKLDSQQDLQSYVSGWQSYTKNAELLDEKYEDDIKSLDIFYRDNDSFKLAASFDKDKVGQSYSSMAYVIAWNSNWPSAQKIVDKDNNNYYWLVVSPLKDSLGNKKALLVMTLSANAIDTVLSVALTQSYLILIFSVIIIILLLLVNSSLFESAMLYNKIKEIDQMKDEFISMASHELRTPVTVIRGYIVMLMDDAKKLSIGNEALQYLSIIKVSTERLNSLIEDLLNVSRIEQGRMKIDSVSIDIWPIIQNVVNQFSVQASEKKLILSCQIDSGSQSVVSVDKDRLEQVLINIIGNAIKYTLAGTVEIKAKSQGNSFFIMIKDSGIGMSAKEREHLFEKFYRVKNKKTNDIIGTGLGLWITKQIVELMGGAISVDSMEGVGSLFTLEFPLAKEQKK